MQSSKQASQKTDETPSAVETCVKQNKKTIKLTIKTMTGKRFEVSADPADLIRVLKMAIEKVEGLEKRLQKLMFAGRVLENARTLESYNLQEGALIYLLKRNLKAQKGKSTAEDSDEEKADNENGDGDDEDDEDEEDFDDDQIPVEIIYNKNSIVTINVDRDDSISDVKDKIKQNITSSDFKIIYGGKPLRENQKVTEIKGFKSTKNNKFHISGDIQVNVAPEFNLTVFCQQEPFQVPVRSTMPVKEFRSSVQNLVNYSFIMLNNGRILSDDNATLGSCGVEKPEEITVIPESNGGNCLKFMLAIEGVVTNGDQQLKESLNFLPNQQNLNDVFAQGLESVKSLKEYKSKKPEELLAVKLYTLPILFKQLDDYLVNNKDLSCWSIYLKNLMKGLKHLDYYRGFAYLGMKDLLNAATYKKGEKITWKLIPGLTRDQQEARKTAGNNGVIFEFDVTSARDISKLTLSPSEIFVLLPHSCFEVMDVISTPNQATLIKLREIPIPRAPKVLFWVDDNPEYNLYHAKRLEERGTSVVFCTSTKDALDVIESYKWLLSMNNANFRIVSDMVRYENGNPNYKAGIDLLKELFNVYKYKFPVMIFCNNVQKAHEAAQEAHLQGEYLIKNQDDELEDFINF